MIQGADLSSMGAILAEAASRSGDKVAYRFLANGETETASASFDHVYRAARAGAAMLLKVANPGDRSILLCEAGIDFAVGLYSCLLSGIVAVPVPTPHPNRIATKGSQLLEIIRDCRPKVVLASAMYLSKKRDFQAIGWEIAALHFVPIQGACEPGDGALTPVSADDLAVLQYTSGSTSKPKGVMLSHGNLVANQRAIAGIFGDQNQQTFCTWLPAYHDMGLAFYLQPVYHSATTVILPAAHFLQKPTRWLRALSRYDCTFSACPNFALERLADSLEGGTEEAFDLSALEVIAIGAEPVSARSLSRILPMLAAFQLREEAICPCYGLAETVTLATLTSAAKRVAIKTVASEPDLSPLESQQGRVILGGERVGNGCAPPGHELRIVDPAELSVLSDDTVGEIWLRGPSVGRGYWGRPEESAATFGAKLADSTGGYLRTGDIGLVSGGELFILGRHKDLIILCGRNLYPDDVEQIALSAHPGIFAVAVFGVHGEDQGEGLGIATELRRSHTDQAAAVEASIRAAISASFDAEVRSYRAYSQSALPRTTSGKMRRAAIAELMQSSVSPRFQTNSSQPSSARMKI